MKSYIHYYVIIFALVFYNCNAIHFEFANKKTRSLHIEQAVQTGFKKRTALKALQFSTKSKTELKREALSGYLPQLSFNSFTRLSKNVSGFRSIINFKASQLVYSFSGPLDFYKIAKKDEHAAKLTELLFQDRLRHDIERTFLLSWLTQKQYKQSVTLAYSAHSTFERDKNMQKQQLLNKDNWLKSKATYAQNTTTASLLEQDLSILQGNLEQRIGVIFEGHLNIAAQRSCKEDSPSSCIQTELLLSCTNKPLFLCWSPRNSIRLKSLGYYKNQALKHRKELQIKDQEIKREVYIKRFHRNSYLPTISIEGLLSRDDVVATAAIQGPTIISQVAGINISWDIFDGMSRHYKAESAHANMMHLRMERHDMKTIIIDEVTTTHNQEKILIKQLNAQTAQLIKAHNDFILKKQKFDIGLIAKPDLDSACFEWENEKFEWLKIRVDSEIGMKNLLLTTGYPPQNI